MQLYSPLSLCAHCTKKQKAEGAPGNEANLPSSIEKGVRSRLSVAVLGSWVEVMKNQTHCCTRLPLGSHISLVLLQFLLEGPAASPKGWQTLQPTRHCCHKCSKLCILVFVPHLIWHNKDCIIIPRAHKNGRLE